MADEGWIKLYRKIKESAIWNINTKFDERSAWIDLLLMATHKEIEMIEGHRPFTLKPGQIKTSKKHLAERWHWSRARVDRYIEMLKKMKMLSELVTTNGATLTIENWAFYQDVRATNVTTDVTSNVTTGVATGVTTDVTQTRNKECKNDKEVKNNIGPAAPPLSPWGGEWQ